MYHMAYLLNKDKQCVLILVDIQSAGVICVLLHLLTLMSLPQWTAEICQLFLNVILKPPKKATEN